MGGNTLAEGDGSGNLTAEYIYFGGKRIARIDLPANTVHYYLSDHLGSTSVVVSAAGALEEESDYYPFGTEVVVAGPGANELKFTGKRRDTESQLDYFGARYYSNVFGRFLTPDWAAKPAAVPYAELTDPQSLNLYTYVRDIPTSKVDADGHCADHYKDGSCKVNVDPKTGDAGVKAAKQLEGVLNKYDKAINALGDKSKFDIKDSKGNVIGSLSGKEIKAVWNGTSFSVVSEHFANGGAGGGTGGTWNGSSFSGSSKLTVGAVATYVDSAENHGRDSFVGVSTLTFHELAHETHFGEELTKKYPVGPIISNEREEGTSSAGKRMAETVDAPFICSMAGGCQ
jgi:RHS repeat-associated protein